MEYVASSHSQTACPDGFDEFYNQRRRWTPSTLANQWELLSNFWVLLKYGNTNIVHLIYLVIMLLAGLIGPGSVFLLLVGGLHIALDMGLWASFALNATFATIFFVVSIFFGQKSQLFVAKVLSVLYGIVMVVIMAVLVIEAIRLRDHCAFTPTTTTLIIVASAYIFAGLFHPTQLSTLPWGVIYYLTIPCMYFFLSFYCLFNLKDKTWGTRDTSKKADESSSFWSQLIGKKSKEEVFSFAVETREETRDRNNTSWTHKMRLGSRTNDIEIEGVIGDESLDGRHWKRVCEKLKPLGEDKERDEKIDSDLEALRLNAILAFLFCNVIFVFTIFLMQVRFDNGEGFSVDWPLCELDSILSQNTSFTLDPSQNITTMTTTPAPFFEYFIPERNTRETAVPTKDAKYLQLDPINFVFMIFFLGVMFFQFLGMLFHRVRNAGHLMATITWPSWPWSNTVSPASNSNNVQNMTNAQNMNDVSHA